MDELLTPKEQRQQEVYKLMYGKKNQLDKVDIDKLYGYKNYSPSVSKRKINAWFGNNSIFASKTYDGALSFLDEMQHKIKKDTAVIIAKIDASEHPQIDTHKFLTSGNDIPEVFVEKNAGRPTQRTASASASASPFHNRESKLHYHREQLKGYSHVVKNNKEIVIHDTKDDGNNGADIIEIFDINTGKGSVLDYDKKINEERLKKTQKGLKEWNFIKIRARDEAEALNQMPQTQSSFGLLPSLPPDATQNEPPLPPLPHNEEPVDAIQNESIYSLPPGVS